MPGVVFRPAGFKPMFQKHAGRECGGVQMHVTNREVFQPVRASLMLLAVMRELSGEHFRWRTETYEFVNDPIAIDLLLGSSRERMALESGCHWRDIVDAWPGEEADFQARRRGILIYPE